ncbi:MULTISPECIES: DUF883 family protein [unclassified Aureimonas]|jgi:ElaB/YqjD/DUF883 family membrane-anchored ribosome-binding protein|uniref:DUF883 family protein n=1 Tax=unclassified Aureimonas TaxID=2615206 RepID=UPI0006FF11EA|nr:MULTISPECIES: hypothetical protein [unclassified Aureimonas]KQT64208.1 hypothetical protein ASG62_04235 [Aureimonas sp. Leaf427]KQT81397.1 hypothetical protein ASG54_01505 [Aureimonas sp. Leaf460]
MSESTSNDYTSNSDPLGSGRSTDKDLEVQVSRLREDVAGVAEALKALATDRADGAKRQAYALRDDVRDRGERYLQQAQEAASEFESEVSERVRAEPIKAVLIAAAAGYLYARLFR